MAALPTAGAAARPALPRAHGVQVAALPAAAVEVVLAQHAQHAPGGAGQVGDAGAAGGNAAQQRQAYQHVLDSVRGAFAMAGQPGAGAAAQAARDGAPAAAAPGQPVVRFTVGPPGQGVPVAVPVVQVPGAGGAGDAPAMPAEVADVAQRLLAQLGVPPAGQQQLLSQFRGITQALRQSSGEWWLAPSRPLACSTWWSSGLPTRCCEGSVPTPPTPAALVGSAP